MLYLFCNAVYLAIIINYYVHINFLLKSIALVSTPEEESLC